MVFKTPKPGQQAVDLQRQRLQKKGLGQTDKSSGGKKLIVACETFSTEI
jgi:hypothetical protein